MGSIESADLASVVTEFGKAFNKVRPQPVDTELDVPTLKAILDGLSSASIAEKSSVLARHIAAHSASTQSAILPMVTEAVTANPTDTTAAATTVSNSLPPAFVGSGEVDLSNPIPLNGWARLGFAAAMAVVTILAVIFIFLSNATGTAQFVALGVAAGFGWLGTVIFVMGYQTIALKGSTGTPAAAAPTS